jgi:hypothetical protein
MKEIAEKPAVKQSKDELLGKIAVLESKIDAQSLKIDTLIEHIKIFKLNFNSQMLNGKMRVA